MGLLRKPKPLTDDELRERGRNHLRAHREAERRVRSGKGQPGDYQLSRESVAQATAIRDELATRQTQRRSAAGVEREARERGPSVSLAFVRDRVFRAELEGVTRLDTSGFSREDREELSRLRRLSREGELSGKHRRALERLVNKAAEAGGNGPGLLARRRRELDAAARRKQEADRLHTAMLPRRRAPEPGSVELPRFLWGWVTDGRDDTFSLNDLGLLAGLAFSFANHSAALFSSRFTRIDRDDAGPVLTITDAGAGVRLASGVNPSGGIDVRDSLSALARNGWVVVERNGKTLRLRPGERMHSLFPIGQL